MKLKVCVHNISLTNGWSLTEVAQRMGQRSDWILVTLTLFSRSLHYKYSKKQALLIQQKVCVHIISLTNRWNLTKLAQIHHQDWGKK